MGKLFIITGASGFVGRNIIKKLCESKADLKIIAIGNSNKIIIKDKRVKVVYADIRDITSLEPIFNIQLFDEKYCIHCAGKISINSNNNKSLYDTNVLGTKNIVKMCLRHKFTKLVYVSTVDILKGNNDGKMVIEQNYFDEKDYIGDYAKTKAIATQYVINQCKRGLNAVIVYPSAIIGPYFNKISGPNILIDKYIYKKLLFILNGGYDFIDVRDVVNGILLAVKKGKIGCGYILSNKYYSVENLINKLNEVTLLNNKKIIVNDYIINLIAPLFEKICRSFHRKIYLTPYSVYVLRSNLRFNHNKAVNELGFKPISFDKTLRDTIEYMKKVTNSKK